MIRHRRALAAALGLVLLAGPAAAQTGAGQDDHGPAFSEAGQQIKHGAVEFGHGVAEGAKVVGKTVQQGAVSLWQAGKAAAAAASRKLSGPPAAPPARQ